MALRRREANYDLWEECDHTDTSKSESHKKKKRSQYTPSILSSVQVPHEGASYNPPIESYVEYAKDIAKVEAKVLAEEKRVMVAMKMASSSKLATENFREEFHVFTDAMHTKNKLDDDFFKKDKVNDGETSAVETETAKAKQLKPKTLKKKRDAHIRRLVAGLSTNDNVQKNIKQQLINLKSLTKSVRKEMTVREAEALKRRKERAVRRLTGKRRLGRGKFEKFVDPVLLPQDFRGTMRSARQHSDLLKERLNSFQRRNILPTAGGKQRSLKMSLRARVVEKRSTKEITEDYRII